MPKWTSSRHQWQPATLPQQLLYLASLAFTLSVPGGTRQFLKKIHAYLAQMPGKPRPEPTHISQTLYSLKKRKLLRMTQQGDTVSIELTEQGRKRHLRYIFNAMKIRPQKPWDGQWRLLLFDIPEERKAAREALRARLKQLGFLQFQKSVWIHPYPCDDEIDFVSELFGVGRYINLLSVRIEHDDPLRRHFRLQ